MSEAGRAASHDAAPTRPTPTAREVNGGSEAATVGNLAIAHSLRSGAAGTSFAGPPLGNQDQQRSQPVRCSGCEAKARRYGVQAKCAACDIPPQAACNTREDELPLGNLPIQNKLQRKAVQAKKADGNGRSALSAPGDGDEKRADEAADRLAPQLRKTPFFTPPHEENLPLPAAVREVAEPSLGEDLSSVRLHTGSQAADSARALGALAFTSGHDVVFGAGRLAPTTSDGAHLLAHELAHVAQQKRGTAEALVQRQQPPGQIYVVVEGDEPLSRYKKLAQVLDADSWQRLNFGARRRIVMSAKGGKCEAGQDDSSLMQLQEKAISQVTVPLGQLLVPDPGPIVFGQSDFVSRMYRLLASDDALPSMIANEPLYEAVSRWINANPDVASSDVTVELIDPEGTLGGDSGLTFQVGGKPVQTTDGSLFILPIDKARGSNSATGIQADVTAELNDAGQAASLAHLVRSELARGRDIIAQGYHDVTEAYLQAWNTQMQTSLASAQGYGGKAAKLLAPTTATLSSFIEGDAKTFAGGLKGYAEKHKPEKGNMANFCGEAKKRADELFERKKRGESVGAMDLLEAMDSMKLCSKVPGTEPEYKAQQDFQAGLISLGQLEKISSEIHFRAGVAAGITLGLTALSMGLAGPILGATPSVLSVALYGGVTTALTTVVPMTFESLYTLSTVEGLDPYTQQALMAGYHTPGDIAVGGLVSFGLGAGIGGLMGWATKAPSPGVMKALVAPETATTTALADGVTVNQAGSHVVELKMPGQPGTIRVTQSGYQIMAPAGTEGKLTTIASVPFPEEPSPIFKINLGANQEPMGLQVNDQGFITWGQPKTPQTPMFTAGGTKIVVNPDPQFAGFFGGKGLYQSAETESMLARFGIGADADLGSLTAGGRMRPVMFNFPTNSLGSSSIAAASKQPSLIFLDPAMWKPPAAFAELPAGRLPSLPEGWAWSRVGDNWVPVHPEGAGQAVDVFLYRDSQGRMNVNLRTADGKFVSSSAMTRPAGGTSGLPRNYPMATADYLEQGSGLPWDRGHVIEHADTLTGSGVANSSAEATNYVPEPEWWNRRIRSPLVGKIRARGNGYRMTYYYDTNPKLTANGTMIPKGVYFTEVTPGGQTVSAWNVPFTDPVNGPTGLNALGQFSISPADLPATPVNPPVTNPPTTPTGP